MRPPMPDSAQLATVVILSALGILLLLGVAVVLLIVVRQRRVRHAAEVARMQLQHADAMRQVEREALDQALGEVGRELHDNVGQMLAAVLADARRLDIQDPAAPPGHGIAALTEQAIAEVRRLSRSLSTEHLQGRPLHVLLREECERLHRPEWRAVSFALQGTGASLPPDMHVVFFRIFQEAVSNALKHAQARTISVLLEEGTVHRLTITDNGRGFDTTNAKGNGLGLGSIGKRAQLIGARCTVHSVPGEGTIVTVEK